MQDIMRLVHVRAMTKSGAAKMIREAARLSQSDIADAIDVTPSTLSRWEANKRIPRGAAAIRYFDALDELVHGLERLDRVKVIRKTDA